ncbi:MAG: response regulator transcription factor [Betaproteobacteria bacterium]|nr:MAG: response regulator transcription factor [Betaproteobacteria bacterium]
MKILVVDDYALVREGLRHALQALDDSVEVLEARDAEEALRLIAQQPALDLVLLDIGLPGMDGFLALDEFRRAHSAVPVVVLSASAAQRDIAAALNMGAMGYIPKMAPREVMLRALRLVLAGGVYIPPQAIGMHDYTGSAAAGATAVPQSLEELGLTDRQRQVLGLIAQGKPNKVIANELQISEPTVKAHVTEILRALKASSRAQAMVTARRFGLR